MVDKLSKDTAKPKQATKFTTFQGVFVPSVLAIFGAVMFLILPKTLGGVGILQVFLIILLAHSVSIATAYSLSSIATNIKVKGGGLYYLISRSLGTEFGGGLGIQLFLAQTVGISFYCIAFARGLNGVLQGMGIFYSETLIAFVMCAFFGIVAYLGAKFVIKLQYWILGAIALALLSIFAAPWGSGNAGMLMQVSLPFWVAFAMFFPAVTGIDAGVAMSGDLKNPRRSLVNGTFAAIVITMVVYLFLAIKMWFTVPAVDLFNDPLIITNMSVFAPIVILGILLATASSALSYFMAGPRTLRRLALDNIFGSKIKFLGNSVGQSTEPRIALFVSLGIALFVILSGDLDFVSQIVTVFFLNVYGWINGAAFFEKISRNPSFRPSFNSPTAVSFYGMIISYFIMYMYNPWIMAGSIVFQLSVFYVLFKTKASVKLESVWDGVLFQLLRKVTNKIEETERSKKNWRPTIMAFCGNTVNRNLIFSLLDWIGSNRGIMKFYYMIGGRVKYKEREVEEADMKNYLKDNGLEIYPKVIDANSVEPAVETILQSEAIGNLPPNTVLMDFDSSFQLNKIVKMTTKLKKNVIILKNNSGFSDFSYVDVWWDTPDEGNLMMLIAYLISHSKTWKEKDAQIRLYKVVSNKKDYENYRSRLNKLVDDSRIENITVNVIIETKKKFNKLVKEHSKYADLVLMGLPHARSKGLKGDIEKEIIKYTEGLTTTLLVLANDKIDFRIN